MKNLPASDIAVDACWRRIGVAGDASCGELTRHVHCRNCPVYAGAARHNLQRTVDPAYREAWARELARAEPPPIVTDSAALVFRVLDEWLAVPVALVAAVAPTAPVHRLPHRAGGALLGVVNVDGRLTPAVSMALLLGLDQGRRSAATPLGRHAFARLLVLAIDGQAFALPVDEVHGMLRHAGAAMRAAGGGEVLAPLVAGVIRDSSMEASLLDADRLQARLKEALR